MYPLCVCTGGFDGQLESASVSSKLFHASDYSSSENFAHHGKFTYKGKYTSLGK